MVDESAMASTASDTVLLKYVGMQPIVVHGGGPEITRSMNKLGKDPKFIKGLRVTDEETMAIVKMVLVGRINTDIVSQICLHDGKGAGLSGKDNKLIQACKKIQDRKSMRRCTPTLSRPCPGLPCSQRWSLVEALPMPCPLKPSVPTPALTRSERLVWGGAGRTARRPMPGWPWPQGKLRGHLEPERPICCCPGFLLWPSPHGWARSRPSWALGTS